MVSAGDVVRSCLVVLGDVDILKKRGTWQEAQQSRDSFENDYLKLLQKYDQTGEDRLLMAKLRQVFEEAGQRLPAPLMDWMKILLMKRKSGRVMKRVLRMSRMKVVKSRMKEMKEMKEKKEMNRMKEMEMKRKKRKQAKTTNLMTKPKAKLLRKILMAKSKLHPKVGR